MGGELHTPVISGDFLKMETKKDLVQRLAGLRVNEVPTSSTDLENPDISEKRRKYFSVLLCFMR